MEAVLEATAGPLRGQRLSLPDGDVVTVGRTSKSKIAIPDDKFLSGIHFAVVWKGDSGRLVDHGRQLLLDSGKLGLRFHRSQFQL